jgi:hypothetical protein
VRGWAPVAILLAFALSGCTGAPSLAPSPPVAPSSAPSISPRCESAIANTPPIAKQPGLEVLVSTDLALTVESCSTMAEWEAALRAHPEVVSASILSADEALSYLLSACGFAGSINSSDAPAPVCAEATDAGLTF